MGMLAMIFVAVAKKGSDDRKEPTESVAENEVEFDRETALGDDALRGALLDARTLAAAVDRNELDRSGAEESRDDSYERALVVANAASFEELINEKESVDWFIDELMTTRARIESSFSEQRSRLATAEAALARLRSDLETSKRKLETLQGESVAKKDETAVDLQDHINALDGEITSLEQEIEKLRENSKDARRSYAIVPYQGKKGTYRRPIYIECAASGVYLQPEGIRFDDSDFLIADYPGNPFDSALRAASRHYLETTGGKTASGEKIEAYPLLIVRPGGSKYFYAAVAALASWGDLYGYEFVAEDQKLEYPESDPTLKRLVVEQANLSRNRLSLQLSQAVAARRAVLREQGFGSSEGRGAGSERNFIGGGGSGTSDLQARLGSNARIGAANPAAARVRVSDKETSAATSQPRASSQGTSSVGNVAQSSGRDSQFRNVAAPDGRRETGADFGAAFDRALASRNYSDAVIDAQKVALSTRSENASGAVGTYDESSDASSETLGMGRGEESGRGAAQNGSQTRCASNAAATEVEGSAPGFLANMIAAGEPSEKAPNIDARKTLGNTAYARDADGESGVGELAKNRSRDSDENRVASTSTEPRAIRLSQETPVASGIERAVFARCESDAIVFPKQPGMKKSISIALNSSLSASEREQELLDAFTFCVKSWGLAGRNAYWAPYVKAEVAEGGEERFDELSAFCKIQGLAIVRVDANSTVK